MNIEVNEISRVKKFHVSSKDALSHTAMVTSLFNSGIVVNNGITSYIEKAIFFILLVALSFVATMAVFARSGIDTWIQFSLYIVPLIAMICGHHIFKSRTFKQIFGSRNLTCNCGDIGAANIAFSLQQYLKSRSLRTCLYPLSLVFYQWTVFMIFFQNVGNSQFSGPLNISTHSSSLSRSLNLVLKRQIWLPLYYTFWTIAMYVTGFVACSFILVVHIHLFHVKCFLSKIGEGPMVQKFINQRVKSLRHNEPPYEAMGDIAPVGFFRRGVSYVTGFLTLGLVELDSFHAESDNGQPGETGGSHEGLRDGVSPREASKELSDLISCLERNSSLFKPFLVLLTFFSVTNLVTHVVVMAVLKSVQFTDAHWWTLVRTIFWFLLAIRLLWTVATITRTLSRIIPHIHYLRSLGALPGNNEEWREFFLLAESFELGTKTYGFPLTLNQVASIVALVNFSFLIGLSLISKTR